MNENKNKNAGANKKPRRKFSLLAKISALAAAASLLMTAVIAVFVGVFFDDVRHHHHGKHEWAARAVARGVYKNPSPARINEIAEENDLRLRYRGPFGEYATDSGMPEFEDISRVRKRRGGFAFARADGERVILHRAGPHFLMMQPEDDDWGPWSAAPAAIVFLILAMVFLWAAFYWTQRRWLAPLGQLRGDMEAVGRGEWREAQIARDDDIGELAAVFNRMQKQLRRTLAAKERFLADASHELRSPLARLKLASEMVGDEKLRASLVADIAELESLAGDILEKTRLEAAGITAQKTPVAIADIFTKLRRRFPNVLFAAEGGATVLADAPSLERALANVLENAIRFAESKVQTRCFCENREAVVVVADDGPGVPEKDLPHLFEPFYRADSSRARATGGFGLGMAIAAAAAKAHGGTVRAKNNDGLVVEFRLPLHCA